jgi:hypothetical protein
VVNSFAGGHNSCGEWRDRNLLRLADRVEEEASAREEYLKGQSRDDPGKLQVVVSLNWTTPSAPRLAPRTDF